MSKAPYSPKKIAVRVNVKEEILDSHGRGIILSEKTCQRNL
jgi:hypothetical protein